MRAGLVVLFVSWVAPACARLAAPETAPTRRSCFILREIDGPVTVHKGGACGDLFPPASTFKVPHAMIALDSGARSGPDDREKWDGRSRGLAVWDQDQTLATAIEHSAVWYFQRTAEKIGRDRMQGYLSKLGYGNQFIGSDIALFWLDGSLRISADEQARFMERFVRRELPLRRDAMDAVDALLRQKPGTFARATPVDVDVTWDPPQTELFGKTGSVESGSDNVRWAVGHVTSHGKRFVFTSLVVAREELSIEAITQAMHELRDAGLLSRKD
jgi:beta-lactamase class D